ncbi:DUF4159 domain-containing protein [Roseiconus nitratireducens]|uniref:DUF4159 domain-containing protein n=1 Tax=Roseiconus nitratireducens TaxID=2605748 RepID=A0A5M6CZY1_9BACT|nr:DUF4159 domain-containing protein [Roseiconus nitratireducens]KAA5539602.1 DUF4159 domain-containing protein [Roseiconus nitratireducens]
MFRFTAPLLLLLTFAVCHAPMARADVDAAAVNRAIERGITYLRKAQNDRGGWDEYAGQSCGLSSLCTLALLNAGVSRDDPAITQAMKYLRATIADETYSVSLQTLVFCQVGAAADMPRIKNNVSWLTRSQIDSGGNSGAWTYGGKRSGGGDPSNTQFALLALGAAQDRGVDVDPQVFARSIQYWEKRQTQSGGWGYGTSQPTGSMTCAGVASLIIANGRLGNSSSSIENGQIQCCGSDDTAEDPIQKGLEWLGDRFSVDANPGGHSGTYFYYLYAIERTGRLSGRRFFGGYDWYREGADKLIALQDDFQGYWSGGDWEGPTIATSFALLFLSKGKRQVVIGQLERRTPDRSEWQPHPDSLRQLVRHVERAWGRDLTWQTVQSESASVADLLQTPVLVISGKQALQIDGPRSDLLKDYIDQGGTILFDSSGDNGCGNPAEFQATVKQLCARWYPGSPLERLPTSHPIWSAERTVDIDAMPNGFWVYGVQACCRTAVFYVPQSLTCRWELGDVLYERGPADDPVRRQIDHSIRLGQNLVAYATGRELKDKLDNPIVLRADSLPTAQRGTTRIARLDVGAGGEDARRALPNVSTLIRDQAQIPVSVPEDSVGFTDADLAEVTVLWIHGRREFELSSEQREVLKNFLDRDGVILGTAICGNEAFAASFRREIAGLLGGEAMRPMPADHPMLTDQYFGYNLRSVTIRRPSRGGQGQSIRRQTGPPLLEYAEVGGIVGVVFSPLDLSCALESLNSVQCPGYATEDAAKIVTNVVQMALYQ